MKSFPKTHPFAVPEGYFEALPDQIIRRKNMPAPKSYLGWAAAAAAVLLLSVGLWQTQLNDQEPLPLTLEEEALLYIESEQWSTEDVLSLSEDPNELLDQIIEEEFAKTEPLWNEEETWF
jgi:hypothetical protein